VITNWICSFLSRTCLCFRNFSWSNWSLLRGCRGFFQNFLSYLCEFFFLFLIIWLFFIIFCCREELINIDNIFKETPLWLDIVLEFNFLLCRKLSSWLCHHLSRKLRLHLKFGLSLWSTLTGYVEHTFYSLKRGCLSLSFDSLLHECLNL